MTQLNPLFEKLAAKIGNLEVHVAALEIDLQMAQGRIGDLEHQLAHAKEGTPADHKHGPALTNGDLLGDAEVAGE